MTAPAATAPAATATAPPANTLAVWSPLDDVLGAVAPLALGVAAGTALVVDLDPDGPAYPGSGSLAALVADGPTAVDLRPGRRGVAVLRNGGVDEDAAAELLAAFASGWPRVVLRLPATAQRPERSGVVPVLPLIPGDIYSVDGPAVYQRGPWSVGDPPDGVVLPRPHTSTIRELLEGRRPRPSRWLRCWSTVWEREWP